MPTTATEICFHHPCGGILGELVVTVLLAFYKMFTIELALFFKKTSSNPIATERGINKWYNFIFNPCYMYIRFLGIKVWNEIDDETKSLKPPKFKPKVKNYLLDQYIY